MRLRLFAAFTALLTCICGQPVLAANLLVNGDFEMVTMTNGNAQHSTIFGTSDAGLPQVTGWTTSGFNFVMMNNPGYNAGAPNTLTGADDYFDGAYTTGVVSPTRFALWGPDSNPSTNNGLTGSPVVTGPQAGGGGNFIAADGAYLDRPIEQVVSGLTVGRQYHLSFYWAAAQQVTFDGVTSEGWTVCFGVCSYTPPPGLEGTTLFNADPLSEIHSTTIVDNANHGFVPWQFAEMSFTAKSTTQTLSLLAYGTPVGKPPFALIDNVQLTVPEPTSWAMMLIGFGLIGGVMRTRRRPMNGRRALNAQIV